MDHYQILGIKRSASLEEIKLAYRKLAKEYHPDRNVGNPDAEEKFKLITEAYNILSNSAKKAMYDFSGEGFFAQPWVNVYTYQNSTSPAPQAEKGIKGFWNSFLNFWRRLFSKKSKIFTAFSVFIIILAIGLVSYKLINLTSHYYFNTGLKQYEGKQYNLALQSLEQSLTFFGTKNAEAYLLTAKILLEEYRDYEQALHFIDKGLKLPGKKVLKAKLYYLKGKCLKGQQKFRSAYTNFKLASVMDLPMDSLHFELAELNCFIFKNYEDAIQNFNTLISINPTFADAYLGRAYSFQQLEEHQKAVKDVKKYLTFDNEEGTAYYIKAVSEIALNHPTTACKDLQEAVRLGMKGATELIAKTCR